MRKFILLPLLCLAACSSSTSHPAPLSSSVSPPEASGTVPPLPSSSPPAAPRPSLGFESTLNLSGFLPPKTCGGPGLPLCKLGDSCQQNSDCASSACNYQGLCIADRSCVAHNGGDTCNNESCCISDLLPNGTYIDRYKTTAGRMRTFIEATGGNVVDWYNANKDSLSALAISQIDPFVQYLPSGMTGSDYSVVAQLGGSIQYEAGFPSDAPGCDISSGAGTHTFWFSPEMNALYGQPPQGFSQDYLDKLYLNCVSMPLASAFCAWQAPGGHLQTLDESNLGYGYGQPHVWDNAGGYANVTTNNITAWTLVGPAIGPTFDYGSGPCNTCDPTIINWAWTYGGGAPNPLAPNDYSYWISPPGFFPKDIGPYGTRDVAGTFLEMTSTVANFTDPTTGKTLYSWSAAGSLQGHQLEHFSAEPVMTVYSMASFRCAH